MSFGENLQFFRKKNSITQEELAERLNVSRQSVSKWESDTSFPETDKIIQISNMFGCTIDTLIKGNAEKESAEDKASYDKHMNGYAKAAACAVGLIIGGLSVSGVLDALSETYAYLETVAGMTFFLFLLAAVMIFVVCGINHENFRKNNPHINNFYKENQIKDFEKKYPIRAAVGIGIIIFGLIAEIGIDAMPKSILKNCLENFAFLFCVSIGSSVIVYNGMLKNKFNIDKYNKEIIKEKNPSKYSKLYGIIMILSTMAFLVLGFIDDDMWKYSWISFVVGGLLCGIVAIIDNSNEN